MLSERHQTEMTTYYMITFTQIVQKRQIYRGRVRIKYSQAEASFRGDRDVPKLDLMIAARLYKLHIIINEPVLIMKEVDNRGRSVFLEINLEVNI